MSDVTPPPTTPEASPSGEFKKPEAKRLAWHGIIFGLAATLTPLVDLIVKALSDGTINVGKYNVLILGVLTLIGQFIRLTLSGQPAAKTGE